MPKVRISDPGIEFAGTAGSSITRYFLRILRLRPSEADGNLIAEVANTRLRDVPVRGARIGLVVEEDVEVGNTGVEWKVAGGTTAHLQLWTKEGEAVLSAERFGPETSLRVAANQAYMSFAVTGQLSSGISRELGDVTFGFQGGSKLTAAFYRPFSAEETLRKGLEETIGGFTLPGDVEDLASLEKGAVASVTGVGSLKFTANGEFSVSVNPVAVEIPMVDTPLNAGAGGAVEFDFSAEYQGEYELRVCSLGGKKVSLGYYKKDQTEFTVVVTASAGASVRVGRRDLLETLLGVVSAKPEVDREFLSRAGLSDERIAELEQTVSAAVQRKLESSLELGFGRLGSDEAAFLWTVDLAALDAAGRLAVSKALDGDLAKLTETAHAGVVMERSILRETLEQSRRLRVNLFGIFNYSSVFELIREGREVFDAGSGELFLLDKATANRRKAWIVNTRELATEKVSQLMADTILISVAYRACREPEKKDAIPAIQHWYFEYQRRTKRADLKDHFDVAAALGFVQRDEIEGFLERQHYGRTALLAETAYDGEAAESIFLDASGGAHSRSAYEAAGRKAVELLETGDKADGERGLLGSNDEVFRIVKEAGTRENAVRALARVRVNGAAIPETIRHAMYSDYLAIEWWAEAMAELASKLSELRSLRQSLPEVSSPDTSNRHKKLRRELQNALADVAARTKPMFGEPWGLVAMYEAAAGGGWAHVQITTDAAVYEYERGRVQAAPA